MAKYRNGSHTVYDIKYHFVWITKYRYKILKGNVAFRLRELLVQGCEAYGIKILKGGDRLIDNSDRKYRYHCKSLESMSEELTFQERCIDTEEDFTLLCGIKDFTDLVQNEELAALRLV